MDSNICYSNMDSDGNMLSVIEEALNERVRRRTFFQKYICCCLFPKQFGTLDTQYTRPIIS